MKFIKVHNIDGGDLLINTDKVATIYQRTKGGAIVNYFDGSTAPVTETVDELSAMLLKNFEQQENTEKTERTGRWILVPVHGDSVTFYYCSECKEQIVFPETGENLLPKHCPQCGARMVNGV